ncbi:hypothetical protein EZV61_03865 [Corallincola luteus]|uniref:DUF4149 domain-containing protein n=1 Tax=Corallincola luteus TaxID=1775177 RepID=A0ABY2AR92_9GAMM|nr:hypothetical protein [Corallincola luteus]TCI05108.1 hypothetical protein EZV61_03865 [Corallincola luteus]
MAPPRQLFNVVQLGLSIAILVLGSAVYMFVRPAIGLPYLPDYFPELQPLVQPFVKFSLVLPAFVHPLGFSLLSLSVVNPSRKNLLIVCSFWGGANLLFELAQLPIFASYIQQRMEQAIEIEDHATMLSCILYSGTFDLRDVVAILAGAGTAFLIALATTSRKTTHG